jgi:hemerythrin
MGLIEWTASLKLGIEEIDNQHRVLITMINDLNDAMRKGQGKAILGKIIDGLTSYTATHFKVEEEYFKKLAYPQAASHLVEHDNFMRRVGEFRTSFGQSQLGLSVDIVNFLSDWLVNHIQGTDRKYVPHFKANGLT